MEITFRRSGESALNCITIDLESLKEELYISLRLSLCLDIRMNLDKKTAERKEEKNSERINLTM